MIACNSTVLVGVRINENKINQPKVGGDINISSALQFLHQIMSLPDDFIKEYDRDHYERQPRSKTGVRLVYTLLILVLIVVVLRVVVFILKTQK
jgi:hypothetical protein